MSAKNMSEQSGKKKLADLIDSLRPRVKRGWAVWAESGTWYTAPKVDKRKFGPHAYALPGAYNKGVRDCPCGCFMAGYSSGGPVDPVDPFGPCPKNPKK
jgi:hypothetical protein